MKNIVLCLDGTANEFKLNRTNVVKLFSLLVQDPERQVAYYHPGVGTMPPPGALTWLAQKVTLLLGLAFGYGLKNDIRDAYVYLINNFTPGDRVFIFGFSRGAYTARAVASLLHMYGLIGKDNDPLVPYAIRMMLKCNNAASNRVRDAWFEEARQFKETFSAHDCDPHFVGVWDTVSSVGWIENPVHMPYTADNPSIAIGRHAVAIDERRAFFRTNLWRGKEGAPPAGPKDMKQVWFAGVHCDVGGGYAENVSGPASVALYWMVGEAQAAGLLIDDERRKRFLARYARPDATAPLNRSLTWYWWPAEFLLKRHWDSKKRRWEHRANLGRRRTIPSRAMVHRSVYERGEEYAKRLPPDAISVD